MKIQMKRNLFALIAYQSFIFCPGVWADESKEAKLQTKELMTQFLFQLTALKVYFVSEDKFMDAKNNSDILSHLKEFAKLSKKASHDPVLSQENFRFSRHVLEDHIVDTERMFRLGNKSYARWQLTATASVCMSCHTQIPTASRSSFDEFGSLKIFSSEFDKAEFLFATRAFDKAEEIYDKIIDGYPANNFKTEQVETALERQLAYFSRIVRSPSEAFTKMKVHQKNKELPEYLQRNISVWIAQFDLWKKQPVLDPKTATDRQILEFAQSNIEAKGDSKMFEASNPLLITYLRVSGILYEYLQNHPNSKAVPEVLYWLSLCDRSISNNFFYSLADLYLRECMTQYSTDPVAQKCFKEYETQKIIGYSGSSGTHLPAEVKADLKQLKKLVETSAKVELRGH